MSGSPTRGSDPENLAILRAAVEGAPDATLVRLDRNWGVAGGRNRATALGAGRVVFALDNDAEFDRAGHPGARRPRPGRGAGPRRHRLPHPRARDGRRGPVLLGLSPRPSCRAPPRASTRPPSSAPATPSAAPISRRRAATTTRCSSAGRSTTSSLRAINMGRRIRYRGDIVVRHKVSGEQRFAWSGTRWFHFVRNRLYIEMKFGASCAVPAAALPGLPGQGRPQRGAAAGAPRRPGRAAPRRGVPPAGGGASASTG